jgi:hypothetical protein
MEVLHVAFTLLIFVLSSFLFLAFVVLVILDPAKPEVPEERKKTAQPSIQSTRARSGSLGSVSCITKTTGEKAGIEAAESAAIRPRIWEPASGKWICGTQDVIE